MKLKSLPLGPAFLDPIRSRALLSYARALPLWCHPFLDLLDRESQFVGQYVRLILINTAVGLSLPLFIRLLLGNFVPSGSLILIVSSAVFMLLVTVWNALWIQPLIKRLQLAVFRRLYHHIREVALPYLLSPSRLAHQGSVRAERSLSIPTSAAQLAAFDLLPLLADVPALFLMVVGFVVLAGPSYAPLLLIYVFYVGLDLFYAYARRRAIHSDGGTDFWRSLLRTYHTHKKSFDQNRLFRFVAPIVFNAYSDDFEGKLRESESQQALLSSTEATTDFVTVALISMAAVLVISQGLASSALLAGLLVLLKLTPLVKRTYRDYQSLRARSLNLTWFGEVYQQIDRDRVMRLSKALPAADLDRIVRVQARNVFLSIPTPSFPQSSPQLRGINLDLSGPGLFAFTGRSAAGKSSLLRLLAGVYPLSAGQCLYNGFDREQLTEEQLRMHALYLDRDCTEFPSQLLLHLDAKAANESAVIYVSNLIRSYFEATVPSLIALDEPELWFPELGMQETFNEILSKLKRRHILLVSTRNQDTLSQADRVFLMDHGLCREISAPVSNSSRIRPSAVAVPGSHQSSL
ncbi:MAG: ATP-binding cassette domain-containing protein [bacterium]